MALLINFSFSQPCSAANHIQVTVTLKGALNATRTLPLERRDLISPMSPEDIESAVKTLLKLMILQLGNSSVLSMKTSIEAKTLDFTVT